MLMCEALFRRRISELDAYSENERFAVEVRGRVMWGFLEDD